jgi:uncharacterized protein YcbX
VTDGGGLVLRATGLPALTVPVPAPDADRCQVQIWEDQVAACRAGERADAWVSRFLSTPAHLVYMPDDVRRRPAVPFDLHSQLVSFADGFPYLLVAEESLADLNQRLAQPVELNRFRPNLVIAGATPCAEDNWRQLRIGKVLFRVIKPCTRCRVVNVDPATGEAGEEPLRTLTTYRQHQGSVVFGVNLVAESEGTLKLGDAVQILA